MISAWPDIEFGNPGFLWLVLMLPLFWWWGRGGARRIILLRSLIVLFLVASLAQPQRVEETFERTEPEGRVFVFDVSDSVHPRTRRWMLEEMRRMAPAQGRDRFFVFAGDVRAVEDWEKWLKGQAVEPGIRPQKTNLAAIVARVVEETGAGPVYLFTDGWETEGKVRATFPVLSRSRVRIIPMIPADDPVVPNLRVDRILAPHEADSGAAVRLKLVLRNMSTDPITGKIILERDGRPWKTDTVEVAPGDHLRSYETVLPEEGLVAYQATFVPDNVAQDAYDGDNSTTVWLNVKSKERVLILNNSAQEGRNLEAILRRQSYKVTAVGPSQKLPAPEGFAAVIFNNVPARRVKRAYMTKVREYVANGGAFVMLGANGSFGPGGFRATPIATVLPVELKEPRKKKKKKIRGIVLVIDKSGSMRTDRKLAYAKEATRVLAQNLKNRDLLGVVGFDITPFEVLPLQSMASQRSTVSGQVARLKPGGKTYLYPALLFAKRMLERSAADLRHVIVLSDGETGGSGSDYIDLVSVMKQDLNISVSAVAIGDKANVPLLKRIALSGGGAFHHTYDPSTLPRIVAGEVKDESGEDKPQQKDFQPRLTRSTKLFANFPERRIPPVTGFVDTETRKEADTDLVIGLQDGSRKPLVASWRYGKGKSVVFTADLHGAWTRSWMRWKGLERFWGRILEWATPTQDAIPAHEVRINPSGDRTVMDLFVYGDDALGTFRYALKDKSGTRAGRFRRTAPGYYRAALDIEQPGVYRIEIVEARRGKERKYPPVGYTQTRAPGVEVPNDRFNIELLDAMARATDSEINTPLTMNRAAETLVRSVTPLQMYPILAAAALFLCEVFVRRWTLG